MIAEPLLALALGLAALLAQGGQDAEDDGEPRGGPNRPPPGAEGPLANDAFLPTDESAQERLARGDEALGRAREALATSPEDAAAHYLEAFQAWSEALDHEGRGASVWPAGPDGAAGGRALTEGIVRGVERRLDALEAAERLRWREREEPQARVVLEGTARTPTALLEVAASYPRTPTAVRATIVGADLALERGAYGAARLWLERAHDHLWDGPEAAQLADAIQRRRQALPPTAPPEDDWRGTTGLEAVSGLPLKLGAPEYALQRDPEQADAGLRPGLAFLSQGRLAVQTTHRVHLFRVGERGELSAELHFSPGTLRFAGGGDLPFGPPQFEPFRSRRPPGWLLAPAAADGHLVLVQGHTFQEGLPNALLAIDLPPQRLPESLDPSFPLGGDGTGPRLRWAVVGDQALDRRGRSRVLPELAQLDDLEFQPGPVVIGDLVVAQARSYGDDVRSWLMGFELASGALRWVRLVAAGADLLPDVGRFGVGDAARLSAEPLVAVDGRVFVSTNLGVGALFDALDGRPLWTLKCRRRAFDEPGWNGYGPLRGGTPDAPRVLWAPYDAGSLYTLVPGPLVDPARGRAGAFAAPPLALDEARTLVGGGDPSVVVQGRSGREHTVSAVAPGGSARVDALYLGPEELFPGRGIVSAQRVLCCTTRGVYVFDRARELYLLEYTTLAKTPTQRPGGDLFARGPIVIALGRDAIWSFRAR